MDVKEVYLPPIPDTIQNGKRLSRRSAHQNFTPVTSVNSKNIGEVDNIDMSRI